MKVAGLQARRDTFGLDGMDAGGTGIWDGRDLLAGAVIDWELAQSWIDDRPRCAAGTGWTCETDRARPS